MVMVVGSVANLDFIGGRVACHYLRIRGTDVEGLSMIPFVLGLTLGIALQELVQAWLRNAPLGYEDATGFHYGVPVPSGSGLRPAAPDAEAFVALATQSKSIEA
jgi:hypothetical protein